MAADAAAADSAAASDDRQTGGSDAKDAAMPVTREDTDDAGPRGAEHQAGEAAPAPPADAASAGTGGSGQAGGAAGQSSGGTSGGAGADGQSNWRNNFCIHPPECIALLTTAVALDTCCPDNGETCGYHIVYPQELDDGSCRPNSQIFLKMPGQEEQRVSVAGAPDQLITPDCETRTLLAFSLPGCCLPDNRCGVSTYEAADILLGLVLLPAPYTSVECVSVETLNAQFRASPLAGLGQVPVSDGKCNYADLDMRLPRGSSRLRGGADPATP